MNPNLPSLGSISSLFRHPLALLAGVLLCLAPIAARGQSVAFAGTQQITLPVSGLIYPVGVAVDSAGDIFIADAYDVLELPWTGNSYGSQITLPANGLSYPQGIAMDGAGDLFIVDSYNNRVLELPKTATGYGPQTTLPFNGLNAPWGVALDSAGDVFLTDRTDLETSSSDPRVLELPKTGTGYGSQITLQFTGLLNPEGIALDSAGDVFVATNFQDNPAVWELPWTGTGYGPQITLPFSGLQRPWGIALDSAGNVYLIDNWAESALESPKTATGYGPQIALPTTGLYNPEQVALDSTGDVFIADSQNHRVVEVQRNSANFGGANVCAPGAHTPAPCSQTLTLIYNVNADTTLGTPEVLTGGMGHLDFARAEGSTCTGAVTAGSTCTVNVKFKPLAAGFRNGAVNLTDGSGNFISKTLLSGFGIAATTGAPVAQLSASYVPFGTIPLGTTKTLPLMVANIGGGTLTVAPSITGHSYTISAAESTCAAGVTPGTSCTLVVEFSPTSISSTHDDILTVQTNGGNPTVDLHGSGIGLSVSSTQLNFGTVSSGSTEVLPLTVTNVGLPGTVTVGTKITVSGESIKGHSFEVLTTSENTCLAGIAVGQSCTLPVEFDPTMSGNHADVLALTPFPGGGSTAVWLLGTTP